VRGQPGGITRSPPRGLAVVLLAASVAIILAAIDERNRLFLWLSLALAAIAFANVLSTAGGGRFTVGGTIGRLSWLQ